jgi:myosin-crossreactive antigen
LGDILKNCILHTLRDAFHHKPVLCRERRPFKGYAAKCEEFAFVGQFCKLPNDVVFTVEYSVRSAQTAVYSLLGLDRVASPVFKGNHEPVILLKAFESLHGVNA